jgi:2-aminoadipate transaminase
MSQQRREQIVELSLNYQFLIVADEVYHWLDFESAPIERPTSFAAYHATGTVIALHSFSKILAPSLRLGFACTSVEHVHRMSRHGLIQSGGGASAFASGIVDRLLVQGSLMTFVDGTLRIEYRQRMHVLYDTLMRTFTERHIHCRRPSGGYFLWLTFRDRTVDCDRLLVVARRHGVSFKPGRLFAHDEHDKTRLAHCLRLCFAVADCEHLKHACTRLKRAFDEYKNSDLF